MSFINSDSGHGSSELRLLLLGTMSSGKNCSAATLLDRPAIQGTWGEGSGAEQLGRRRGQCLRGMTEGRRLTVAVGPRWFWSVGRLEEGVARETERTLQLCHPGPHALLLAVPVGQFTPVEAQAAAEVRRLFGEGALLRHGLLLFTCGDYLGGRSVDDYIAREDPGLRELLAHCGGRYAVLNNRRPQERLQVRGLLEAVEGMVARNGGACLHCAMPREEEEEWQEERKVVVVERVMEERKMGVVETVREGVEGLREREMRAEMEMREREARERMEGEERVFRDRALEREMRPSRDLEVERVRAENERKEREFQELREQRKREMRELIERERAMERERMRLESEGEMEREVDTRRRQFQLEEEREKLKEMQRERESKERELEERRFMQEREMQIVRERETRQRETEMEREAQRERDRRQREAEREAQAQRQRLAEKEALVQRQRMAEREAQVPRQRQVQMRRDSEGKTGPQGLQQVREEERDEGEVVEGESRRRSSREAEALLLRQGNSAQHSRRSEPLRQGSRPLEGEGRVSQRLQQQREVEESVQQLQKNGLQAQLPQTGTNTADGALQSLLSENKPSDGLISRLFQRISPLFSSQTEAQADPCAPLPGPLLEAQDPMELRLVLLGSSGAGKTWVANLLMGAGSEAFPGEGVPTQACAKRRGGACGRRLAVVDTPDWFRSEHPAAEVRDQVGRCAVLCAPGPHAFLLCVPLDRPPHQELAALDALTAAFGLGVPRHTLVLLTRVEGLPAGSGSVEDYIIKERPDLQELVHRCGDRYHALGQRGVVGDWAQLQELLEKVEQLVAENRGQCHTCRLFQEAEAKIRQRQKEILRQRGQGEERGGGSRETLLRETRTSGVLLEEEEGLQRRKSRLEEERARAEAEACEYQLSVPPLASPSALAAAPATLAARVGALLVALLRRIPQVTGAAGVLGGLTGLFVGGPMGGAVGATVGSVLTEVGRRKYRVEQ
ncbi:uncharacterized protein LOC136751629 [Amia ocellicauda]|uniref:uncharacterized protein LOC136751629 n=1 Tax=Amia ocellicauda TaxID=2972642 RepID=UPI003464B3F0